MTKQQANSIEPQTHTIAELRAALETDIGRYMQRLQQLRQELAEVETLLIKTQGGLETLALLEKEEK